MSNGSSIGTVAGSALGSLIPGVGTVLGGSLGGALGGLFGGKAPGSRRKNENYGTLRNIYKPGGAEEAAINKTYGQALGAIGQIGGAERQQILQGRTQQIAELNQSMTNRGLYNTSIGAGAGQGFQNIQQNTQIALGNLASQLAGLRANLFTQRGAAQTQRLGTFGNVLSGELAAPSGSWGTQNAPVNYKALGKMGGGIGALFGGTNEYEEEK